MHVLISLFSWLLFFALLPTLGVYDAGLDICLNGEVGSVDMRKDTI